jgi:hypothetical protein
LVGIENFILFFLCSIFNIPINTLLTQNKNLRIIFNNNNNNNNFDKNDNNLNLFFLYDSFSKLCFEINQYIINININNNYNNNYNNNNNNNNNKNKNNNNNNNNKEVKSISLFLFEIIHFTIQNYLLRFDCSCSVNNKNNNNNNSDNDHNYNNRNKNHAKNEIFSLVKSLQDFFEIFYHEIDTNTNNNLNFSIQSLHAEELRNKYEIYYKSFFENKEINDENGVLNSDFEVYNFFYKLFLLLIFLKFVIIIIIIIN